MAALVTWLVGLPGPLSGSVEWTNGGGPVALTLTALLLASVLALFMMRDKAERRQTPLRLRALDKRDVSLPHAA